MAGLVVVAAAIVVPLVATGSGRSEQATAPSAAPSTTASLPAPSVNWAKLPKDNQTDPVVPGWQGVKDPVERTAYDVPKDWKIE